MPSDYFIVSVDGGLAGQGLTFSQDGGNLLGPPVGMQGFGSFVTCEANSTIFYGREQQQILWRPVGSVLVAGCSDVELKAIFDH